MKFKSLMDIPIGYKMELVNEGRFSCSTGTTITRGHTLAAWDGESSVAFTFPDGEWYYLDETDIREIQSQKEQDGKRLDECLSEGIAMLEAERDLLRTEVKELRALLSKSLPSVEAHAGASHMLEGFRPKRNKWDELVDGIRTIMAQAAPDHPEHDLRMVLVPRRSLERIVNHPDTAYVAGHLQDELRPFLDSPVPDVPEQSGLDEALRPIHAMILNALDRDAEEGRAARGEMAAELRATLAAKEVNKI